MLSFENDYSEGAHENVLRFLTETNRVQQPGYGDDAYTREAKEKIRLACEDPDADIFFLSGGTQTNMTVIDGLLSGVEGAVAAETGHISVHEAGAIEWTGHKVLTVPQHEGKMKAEDLEALLSAFEADLTHTHMVWPGLVYISHPTEYGTLYSKAELEALRAVCAPRKIPLYLDGARLGYGLVSPETDVTLPDLCRLCDVFYIGGTKVGALCGEALVFPRHGAPERFFTHIKQHGALMAKGRLIGAQFDALFTDGLYFEISRHAMAMAARLKEGFARRGYRFYLDSPTNQQFIVLDNATRDRLRPHVRFSEWGPLDAGHTIVRFATSWATTPEQIDALMALLDGVQPA